MTPTRLVVRRTLTISVAALAAVLAAFAVLLAVQSRPTETVAQVRASLERDVSALPGVAAAPGPDVPCSWFGVDGAPANGKVRPHVLLSGLEPMAAGAPSDLDAVAAGLAARGWYVERPAGGLEATNPDGRRITAQAGGDLNVEGPCVWPEGERKPLR
ncbi:hypothetical protein [Pseudonocardia sp. GCM10023141]|uniref:hypothetical protein n=1 Tax=Pseudonocardia sp. GCM10023141 TaxID=3252653 RepID=UPI003610C854